MRPVPMLFLTSSLLRLSSPARSSASRRGRVPTVDRIDNEPAALLCIQTSVDFDLMCLARELLVLYDVTEPAGIVAGAQMMLPRSIVDPLGDLLENLEILRLQVE